MGHTIKTRLILLALATATLVSCRSELPSPDRERLSADALVFARHLVARRYADAHVMTSESYRARVSVDSLERAFEFSVPRDMIPRDTLFVQMTDTMDGWATRRPNDVGWVYVVIPGDDTRDGEAVALVFAREGAKVVIREVEIGRP
jgi:hypothetical protein